MSTQEKMYFGAKPNLQVKSSWWKMNLSFFDRKTAQENLQQNINRRKNRTTNRAYLNQPDQDKKDAVL